MKGAARVKQEQRACQRDRDAEGADDDVLPRRLERPRVSLQADEGGAGQRAGLDEDEQQPEVAGLERREHQRGEQAEEGEVEPDLEGAELVGVLLGADVAERAEQGHRGHGHQEEAAERVHVQEAVPAGQRRVAVQRHEQRDRAAERDRGSGRLGQARPAGPGARERCGRPGQRAQRDEDGQGGHPRNSLSSAALAWASWRVSPDTNTTMISTPATMSRKIPASTMNGNVATRVIAPRKTPFSTISQPMSCATVCRRTTIDSEPSRITAVDSGTTADATVPCGSSAGLVTR